MEEILKQALLYDFYGELLTGHQKRVYEDVVLNDYSFSEVAENLGISRQGVHDMIRRCNRLLTGYEEKLHLVERFISLRAQVGQIQKIAGAPIDHSFLTYKKELADYGYQVGKIFMKEQMVCFHKVD